MKTLFFIIGTAFVGLAIINLSYDLELAIAYFVTAIALYYSCILFGIIQQKNAKEKDLNYLLKITQSENLCHMKMYRFAIEENKKLIAKSARWDAECERQRKKSKRQREAKKAIKQFNNLEK
ncbi:MAG: hypothetical protein ACOYMA_19095 [Bacteroidia bacterium]